MKHTIISISALCMIAALCSQLLGSETFVRSVRIAIGLEVVLLILKALESVIQILN